MVAREPGESDADYELRQRDCRHSKSRCVVSSSSEEEEEEEEEEESRAAGSAAGSELGEETRESPKPRAKPKIGFYKPQQRYPGGHLQVEAARSATVAKEGQS